MSAPWIAVFDLSVTRSSPAGSCVLAEVNGLCGLYDITIFSDACDALPGPSLRWVRVPLPRRPGFLRYIVFHLRARRALRKHIAARGRPPILIQATQAQYPGADICYAHFCHRAYLAHRWVEQRSRGARRIARWIANQYNAFWERIAFRAAKCVVVPSRGLASELESTYPFLAGRVITIPNPVDVAAFTRPHDFDRAATLARLGLVAATPILCFAALGDFSRKGLDLIFEALSGMNDRSIRLLVVGGSPSEIAEFSTHAISRGIDRQVLFVGFQHDVRPFFWLADLFVFPSSYETFALVVIQAMAAGVPVVVTRVHGVEDYALEGKTAWFVERNAHALREGIVAALRDRAKLAATGEAARHSVERFDRKHFVAQWHGLAARLGSAYGAVSGE